MTKIIVIALGIRINYGTPNPVGLTKIVLP